LEVLPDGLHSQAPSGKWQATVRDRSGERHSTTDPLKSVVRKWATEKEAQITRGEFRDPRLGEIRIGEWHERVSRARGIEAVTKVKNASLWRTHCEPEWAKWPMAAVGRLEAQEWVNRLASTRRARHQGKAVADGDEDVPLLSAATIADIVHVMSSLYRLAMREHPPLVVANPFADLELPEKEPRPVEFYEHEEAAALYAAAGEWRTLIELGMDVGLRPGELYGLHGHRVDWLRGQLAVIDVMTRQGLRYHPKSKKSHRVVPVRAYVLEGMSVLLQGRNFRVPCTCPLVTDSPAERVRKAAAGPCPGLIFTAPEGGPLSDDHFRNRVWNPSVAAAGIRRFPPRIMRHTAASWLAQDGVPLYDVQALLGHEDYATTQRYAHPAPDAHSKVLESWSRRPDARTTHDAKKARPS
jgi:integrase